MQNRRNFLKSTLALPMMASAGSMLGALTAFNAQAADTSSYKALVCVFLFGGMDCHDAVIPYDQSSYNSYAAIRASLMAEYAKQPGGSSRARSALLALDPAAADFGTRQFALPPQLAGMHQLFEQGNAAIVANVGPLQMPTDSAGFSANAVPLPDRLFSHNDQQSTWMSFAPEGSGLGWGGRFGDAVVQGNSGDVFAQISLYGNTVFLNGDMVSPYQISANGVPAIQLIELAGAKIGPILRDHFASAGADRNSLFERDYIHLSQVSLDANDTLDLALQDGSVLSTAFPATELGAQLRMVAQVMAVQSTLGVSRQVFFVGLHGFDTHSAQAVALPALQQDLGDSVAAFYTATQELGIDQQVTTFTAADFGRTLTVNGDGTDHGWGGHHFVVGGAVNGGDIYGDIPVAQLGHTQDAGHGRLIPQVSVEQYAAPLGSWFGLNQAELNAALPGLANFPADPLGYI